MQRASKQYEELLAACGAQREAVSQDQRAELMQRWRERYAAGLHAATGRWKRDGFEWHVFSFGDARSLGGESALQAYRAERPRSLIVSPEDHRLPAFRLETERLPEFSGADVYVFPESLRWTMAFTHEETSELGPYFSRAEWIVDQPPRRPR
jgi:hypothetical protein